MSAHIHFRRVYYADTDAGGVVYHATYLAMAEEARTEALRAAGAPHAEMLTAHDRVFMVRRVNIEYLRPALLDDLLAITTTQTSATAATITLLQEFFLPDQVLAARADVELVCVRQSTKKPARMPPRFRDILT